MRIVGRLQQALALTLLACATGLAGPAQAAPQRLATAEASDCVACHGDQKLMPSKHKPVKGMTLVDCVKCHEVREESTLRGRFPMFHAHQLAGETCVSCHGKVDKPKAVAADTCLRCHDVDKLVAKTAAVKPYNPHTSKHYGKELECDNCHLAHGKSENYCNQCHEYAYVVP